MLSQNDLTEAKLFERQHGTGVPHESTITFSWFSALSHVSPCLPLFLYSLFRPHENVWPFSQSYDLEMVKTTETLKLQLWAMTTFNKINMQV